MTEDNNLPPENKPNKTEDSPEKEPRHLHLPDLKDLHLPDLTEAGKEAGKLVRQGRTTLQIWLHSAIGIAITILLALFGLLWYASTPQFSSFVRQRVEHSLAASTGGRVELAGFHWSMWHRTLSLDNLTIHGLEPANVAPYMHVDHVEAQLRWSGFFFSSYVYLESLRVIRPGIHLIVNADGTTNQPQPAHPMAPLSQTLLDLAVSHISVEHGLAVVNTKSIPFDFVAADTSLHLKYVPAPPRPINSANPAPEDQYTADFSSDNVHTRTYDEAQVASTMSGHFSFTKDAITLDKFTWATPTTAINATVNLTDFSNPQWHGTVTGTVDIHQAAALTGIDGFSGGIARLNLTAHSCVIAPPAPVPAPRRHILPQFTKPTTIAPPTATCNQPFIIEGEITGSNAAWKNDIVQVVTADTSTRIYVTPKEMDFLDMHGSLANGAAGRGDLHIYNYVGAARLRGVLDATIANVPLHNVLQSLAPPQYAALDYNTAATGDVHVLWTDRLTDSDVHGTMQLTPRPGQPGLPLTGSLQADFAGANSTIKIQSLVLNSPRSTLNATGVLGIVTPGMTDNPLTVLHADLTTHNPAEFDPLLAVYHLSSNNKLVALHGAAEYHGTISGPLHQIDLHGHITADNIDFSPTTLAPTLNWLPKTIHLDSVAADLEASTAGISIQQASLNRGDASLNFSGQLRPELISPTTNPAHPTYAFNKNSTLDLTLSTHNFPIAALINAPLTGALTSQAHLTGPLDQLHGDGHLDARNGNLLNAEPYQDLAATFTAAGPTLALNTITLAIPAGKITGDAAYNTQTTLTAWHLHTGAIVLDHLRSIAPAPHQNPVLTGILFLDARASGTPANPNIIATGTIHSLALAHQVAGTLTAQIHSVGDNLLYDLHSDAFGGQLDATGHTSLAAAHDTQLHATFLSIDLAPLLNLSRFKLSGHSELGGEFSLSGPLSDPAKLTGSASLNRFHVELSGVALDAAEPLHFSMSANTLHLDQVHITGPDTNIRLQGSASFLNAGTLRVHSEGNINIKILQTFDPDLVSSGQVNFTLNASGPIAAPDYVGNVRFAHAAIALADLPNGLSQITGTLNFNRDRLEVSQLTAMTGGGQISLGGTINLRGGIYADITARGKDNRIRYPLGVSSTADTDLRLQGSPSNALLSGSVLLTRFGLNQEFDLANFALANTVSVPADPNSPSSHLRLDVHITSAPQLDFQNSFAKLAGDVDLELRGTAATPSLLGRINISEGSASFAGTQYQLQSGDITFNNPVHIEPLVDLAATTRVRDYDVFIELHGPLANLHPTYRSEPPLSQSDILALLALGRTQEEAQIYQQQQEQGSTTDTQDTTLLGGALNQTVSNRAQRLFGVGSVKLDPTFVGTLGNSSARVTVEQSLTRNVTVTYATNVNETAEQLIQVTWDLTHSVSLVSQRDENGVFSMTFKIRQRHR